MRLSAECRRCPWPAFERASREAIDSFANAGGDPNIIRAIYGVKREYLQASFDEMRSQYGTIEDYFTKALGIDAAGQNVLRERYLIYLVQAK